MKRLSIWLESRRALGCHRTMRRWPRSPRRLAVESLEQRRLLAAQPWLALQDGEGEIEPQVVFRLEAADLSGAPISQIVPGSEFWLKVFVQDRREDAAPAGVFAAYLDVRYDADLLDLAPATGNPLGFDIQFSQFYQNGRFGIADTAGLIDEVGAFQTGFSPLGPGEILLFQARFTAGGLQLVDDRYVGIAEDSRDVGLHVLDNDQFRVGTATMTADPAEHSPAHDVIVFSPPSIVPDAETFFIGTQLQIPDTGIEFITAVGDPSSGGSVRISPDGSYLIYTPAENFFGSESFSYTVGHSATATVTVVVDAVNDAPVAVADHYTVGRNETITVDPLRGLLANDTDVEFESLVARLIDPPEHGTLQLADDGSFTYQPHVDYRGDDHFSYVADDGTSLSEVADVRLEVGSPRVSIRLEVTDASGQPVTRVTNGDPLSVRAWVRDLRDDFYVDRGVFAAYLDVLFDPQQVLPRLDAALPLGFAIDFGDEFEDPGTGDVLEPGVVNEVGSVQAAFGPLGSDECMLFDLPFDVVGPQAAGDAYEVSFQSVKNLLDVLNNDASLIWSTQFTADPADISPESDVLLYEPPLAVPIDEIEYSSATVEIGNDDSLRLVAVGTASQGGTVTIAADGRQLVYSPATGFTGTETFTYTVADASGRTAEALVTIEVRPAWQNLRDPFDVNSDTFVSPIDALLVINDLNALGARPLQDPPTGPPFIDVNGDGFVSPVDALLVINFLNLGGAGAGEAEGESPLSGPSVAGSVFNQPTFPAATASTALLPATRFRSTYREQTTEFSADVPHDLAAGARAELWAIGLSPSPLPAPCRAAHRLWRHEVGDTTCSRHQPSLEEVLDWIATEISRL